MCSNSFSEDRDPVWWPFSTQTEESLSSITFIIYVKHEITTVNVSWVAIDCGIADRIRCHESDEAK